MEKIFCPRCGSTKVRYLDMKQYYCRSCGNRFAA